ncbi:helix-turn-helix domain-containing protein [Emcibacter sp.]|uniref:AraC-like ligand-binding domain-containing protein n=1 Tax=Emcibacter sp. TaxID=1979954 RepID=UPI002AA692CC|nr:helix-turn-helix domain-containing protein [Emcibacter sp.]
MHHYSTDSVTAFNKLLYWNDAVCSTFTELEAVAYQPKEFRASMDTILLGDLPLANPRSAPAQVSRTPKHVSKARDHLFFLHLQLEGKVESQQHGHIAELEEGDMVLCDSASPYTFGFARQSSTLVLGIPAKTLKLHLPAPELSAGLKLSGSRGAGNILQAMLRSIWNQAQEEFTPEVGQRLAQNLLDVLATACSAEHGIIADESAVAGSRRIQIKRYIEANLRDPELSVGKVAAAFNISTRYLHVLFSKSDETVSNYIQRRRIEECARQMSGVIWRGHTITEIAFGWGFNNSTHFARVFRNHYGMSPRDYRNIAVNGNDREQKTLAT